MTKYQINETEFMARRSRYYSCNEETLKTCFELSVDWLTKEFNKWKGESAARSPDLNLFLDSHFDDLSGDFLTKLIMQRQSSLSVEEETNVKSALRSTLYNHLQHLTGTNQNQDWGNLVHELPELFQRGEERWKEWQFFTKNCTGPVKHIGEALLLQTIPNGDLPNKIAEILIAEASTARIHQNGQALTLAMLASSAREERAKIAREYLATICSSACDADSIKALLNQGARQMQIKLETSGR